MAALPLSRTSVKMELGPVVMIGSAGSAPGSLGQDGSTGLGQGGPPVPEKREVVP